MPDATITSTASTFGTISGVFSADQSTISGTISGIVPGTLTGSVGVPGPAGPAGIGLPAGGASGQYLQKTSNADYATDWVTVNLSAYAVKANNLSDLGSISTARDNLGLGSLSTPTFAGVNIPGAGTSVANLGATSLTINQQGSGQFTIQPSQGIVFPNGSIQTTAFTGVPADYITSVSSPLTVTTGNLSIDLSAYLTSATAASTYQTLSGMSSYLTTSTAASTYQTLAGMSDYLAKAGNLAGLANTGTARTNLGLGSLAVVNDAPSDGSQYARKNAAWEVVTTTPDFITSVSSPLAVATGNLTVDLSAYLTSATAASTYQTLAGMSSYLTSATAASTYYLQTNPSGFQTAANVTTALSPYLLSATAASTYAVIAAGQPVAGSAGQVLTKQSGTNYDSIWVTPVVGDRYLSSSTTSNTVSNGNKTFTIGTGLSYSPTQNITISYDASNHMNGEVLTYNSGTGVLTVDINHHTGSGTYASWVVNVGGVTPATSVAWGTVTGTLSAQTDLQSALDLKLAATTAATTYAPLASPSFTGLATFDNSTNYALTLPSGTPGYYSSAASGVYSIFNASTEVIRLSSSGIKYPDGNTQSVAFPGFTGYAPLASPALTGVPTAPTATLGTNTTQIATTAFVLANAPAAPVTSVAGRTGAVTLAVADVSGAAPLAGPTFTGTVTIPSGASISGYLTTTAGDAAYYPLTGNPSGFLTSAPVTSVAGRTGAITLANTDISGLGTMSTATAADYSTTTAANGLYYPLSSNPAGYLTSAPVTSVAGRTGAVTLAVADVSGAAPIASPTFTGTVTIPSGASISGYLTTTAGDAAYYPLTGNPSGFLTSAPVTSVAGRTGAVTLANTDISGLGTMATATAADYSTTTVANGLYYPLSSNPAGYLTTAPVTSVAGRTGAVTLAVADVSGAAPLASPTFSGTPSLPTGTIGVTQTLADNSTKLATTAYVDGSIPANSVKAWVNFNGTGTPAIRASLNVSSLTDHGVGQYTINFTTALADANYAPVFGGPAASDNTKGFVCVAGGYNSALLTKTTTALRIVSGREGTSTLDFTENYVAILR
jgi:hypothetical protein